MSKYILIQWSNGGMSKLNCRNYILKNNFLMLTLADGNFMVINMNSIDYYIRRSTANDE